jgi:hypothetical protein
MDAEIKADLTSQLETMLSKQDEGLAFDEVFGRGARRRFSAAVSKQTWTQRWNGTQSRPLLTELGILVGTGFYREAAPSGAIPHDVQICLTVNVLCLM